MENGVVIAASMIMLRKPQGETSQVGEACDRGLVSHHGLCPPSLQLLASLTCLVESQCIQ